MLNLFVSQAGYISDISVVLWSTASLPLNGFDIKCCCSILLKNIYLKQSWGKVWTFPLLGNIWMFPTRSWVKYKKCTKIMTKCTFGSLGKHYAPVFSCLLCFSNLLIISSASLLLLSCSLEPLHPPLNLTLHFQCWWILCYNKGLVYTLFGIWFLYCCFNSEPSTFENSSSALPVKSGNLSIFMLSKTLQYDDDDDVMFLMKNLFAEIIAVGKAFTG